PQAIAGEIVRLLVSVQERESVGAAGRRYVETYHNWDSAAARLEALYRAAAAPA
ncbi:MAG: glycosyl transferase family 1, partial [Phototrophicales bacterium]